MRTARVTLLFGVIAVAVAGQLSAQFVLFPIEDERGNGPRGICSGPDGNVWFTVANQIGRITPAGDIATFALPTANAGPADIAAGPDGNLWFLEGAARQVGRITTSGNVTEYRIPATDGFPTTIVAGPDGAMWFSDFIRNSVWRVSLTGQFVEYAASTGAIGLAVGSDDNLWFTGFGGPKRVGRMTLSGAVTLFPRPSAPPGWRAAPSPDGNVWYTVVGHGFGRITPSGEITEFPLSSDRGHIPAAIVAGPDGNLWMPVDETWSCITPCTLPPERDGIVRVSLTGAQTRYELPEELRIQDGANITVGPDGAMWFTALRGIGRFFPADLPTGLVEGPDSKRIHRDFDGRLEAPRP